MQGAFAGGRLLPDHDWLSHDWLRSYLHQRDRDTHLLDRPQLGAHPRLVSWFPDPPTEPLQAMRRDRSHFLDALDALPRTLCHLDLHPANLFGDNDGSTTAVDWAFIGVGAIGEDVGNLVPDAVLDFHVDPVLIDDLYETVWNGYTAGLRDAGWGGADSQVRLGMAATIAAKYAWIAPAILRAVDDNEGRLNRRPIDGDPEVVGADGPVLGRAGRRGALARAGPLIACAVVSASHPNAVRCSHEPTFVDASPVDASATRIEALLGEPCWAVLAEQREPTTDMTGQARDGHVRVVRPGCTPRTRAAATGAPPTSTVVRSTQPRRSASPEWPPVVT